MATNARQTGWVGWLMLASAFLLLLGGMQIIAGLVGILNPDFYAVTSSGLMVFNHETWGWVHLLLGIVSMLAGIGVLVGSVWARVYGVFAATLIMLGNIVFLTAYPLWSIVALIINGFVIYALALHGDELAE